MGETLLRKRLHSWVGSACLRSAVLVIDISGSRAKALQKDLKFSDYIECIGYR